MIVVWRERQESGIHPMIDRPILTIQKQAVLVVSRRLWRIAKVGDVSAIRAEGVFSVNRLRCCTKVRRRLRHAIDRQTSAISGVERDIGVVGSVGSEPQLRYAFEPGSNGFSIDV